MMSSTKKAKNEESNPEFISIQELAKRWGYTDSAVYKWINQGKIPTFQPQLSRDKRNKYRIPMDWVLKMEKKYYVRASRKLVA